MNRNIIPSCQGWLNRTLRKISLATKHGQTFANIAKYHYQFRTGQIPMYPVLINLYITEKCNANCQMCHISDARLKHLRRSKGKELDIKRLLEVIREGRSFQPMYYLTGGEPLTFNGLFDVIEGIKRHGSIVAMSSNGILLREVCNEIVEHGVDYISLSLDGSTAKAHDSNRNVDGAFDRLISGIRRLIRRRNGRLFPNIKINTVIRKENIDDLVECFRLAEALGVDQFELEHYAFCSDWVEFLAGKESEIYGLGDEVHGHNIGRPEYMSRQDCNRLAEAVQKIKALAKESRVEFVINHAGIDLGKYYRGDIHSRKSWCNEVFRTIKIRQSGEIELCQGIVVGNMYEKSLLEVWESDRCRKAIGYFLEYGCSVACYRCCSLKMDFGQGRGIGDWCAHIANGAGLTGRRTKERGMA